MLFTPLITLCLAVAGAYARTSHRSDRSLNATAPTKFKVAFETAAGTGTTYLRFVGSNKDVQVESKEAGRFIADWSAKVRLPCLLVYSDG